jgi:hypothetical protein
MSPRHDIRAITVAERHVYIVRWRRPGAPDSSTWATRVFLRLASAERQADYWRGRGYEVAVLCADCTGWRVHPATERTRP